MIVGLHAWAVLESNLASNTYRKLGHKNKRYFVGALLTYRSIVSRMPLFVSKLSYVFDDTALKWRDQILGAIHLVLHTTQISSVSLSAANFVKRIMYKAVIPPSGASVNLGKTGTGIFPAAQRWGRAGSKTPTFYW
ncbi:MAG: hypothetical protein ACI86S_001615 [Paracoccaceae bacterium]|jgi:hypothetical protein